MSVFEKASRQKLRFATRAGNLSVEDLWDLPLSSSVKKVNLDEIAVELHTELNTRKTISFVNNPAKDMDDTQLKFDIVKHIIDVKMAENAKAVGERELAAKKQKIMEIITQKENEALAGQSLEDLRKQLEAL